MSEAEVTAMRIELEKAQEKLCNEKHGTIERRLHDIESKQDRSMWYSITTLVGIIISILIIILK